MREDPTDAHLKPPPRLRPEHRLEVHPEEVMKVSDQQRPLTDDVGPLNRPDTVIVQLVLAAGLMFVPFPDPGFTVELAPPTPDVAILAAADIRAGIAFGS